MKASALIIFIFIAVSGYSQQSINHYKYVIVPEKFSFSKSDNQYGLNALTKILLEEKGFTVFRSNETMPPELTANKCNALIAEVTEKNSLFVTKLTMLLKDCQGNIVFQSREGKSREKEFHTAYDQALRDAYVSMKELPYNYDGSVIAAVQQAAPAAVVTAPATTPVKAPAPSVITENTGILYAQATATGFQLIDTTPKKVLTLLKTSMQDYFIAVDGAINGVVFKKNEEWLYEYYKDEKLVSVKLQIKF